MNTGGASFFSSLVHSPSNSSSRNGRASLFERVRDRLLREFRSHRRYLGYAFRPNIWTVEPVSRNFGFDRGLPIDRFYIEQFLAAEAGAIQGNVLEIEHDLYTRRFGGD